jgi:hypothetical protein
METEEESYLKKLKELKKSTVILASNFKMNVQNTEGNNIQITWIAVYVDWADSL